ncbi:MAG TPA: LLM class F420-dependent oxidoreductase [Acidimicrobiales bacterium]
MKFGIAFANTGPYASPGGAATLAAAAEQAGFDSLWTVEHVIVPREYRSAYPYAPDGKMPGGGHFDIPDPLVWLTWVAAHTTTLRLATGILILPQRNPVVLAKEAATLDALSGGRLVLGVGIGWLEEEFDVLGVPFADRARRTDEYVAALRSLWSHDGDVASFEGDVVSFRDVYCRPRPVDGAVPIVVGGHSPAAARRAGRIGDGFFPGRGDLPALLDEMRMAADGAGRDPDAIEVTWSGATVMGGGDAALEEVGRLADLGVSRLVVPPLSYDPAAVGDRLARFGAEVIDQAR